MNKRMPAHVANYLVEYNKKKFKEQLDAMYDKILEDINDGRDYAYIHVGDLAVPLINYKFDLESNGYFVEKDDVRPWISFYFKKPENKE